MSMDSIDIDLDIDIDDIEIPNDNNNSSNNGTPLKSKLNLKNVSSQLSSSQGSSSSQSATSTQSTISTQSTPTKPKPILLKLSPSKLSIHKPQPKIDSFFTKIEPNYSIDNNNNGNGNLFDRFKNEEEKKPPAQLPKSTLSLSQKPSLKTTTTTATQIIEKDNSMDIDIEIPTTPSKKVSAKRAPAKSPSKKPSATPRGKRKSISKDDDTSEDDDVNENDIDIDLDLDDERTSSSSKPSIPKTPTKKGAFGRSLNKKQLEERYEFLVDIKDAQKRPKTDPNYDPRTLYIPDNFLSKFSPFERQFWEIKAKNYDTVVFFKKGKFYELYESDADIGHQVLQLKMTDRVNMRMVGVPEQAFDHWASKLIDLGYKITKVDQMETAIGKNKRQNLQGEKKTTDSVIQRKVTSILTAGTLVDERMISDQTSTYLMAIKEDETSREYGICLVDVSIGEFYITSFTDDEARMKFETILLQTMPKEIVYEKNSTSTQSLSIIKRVLATIKPILNGRNSLTEYWDPEETIRKIKEIRSSLKDNDKDDEDYLPRILCQEKNDMFSMCALGACISYLIDIKIGEAVVKQARFNKFEPLDIGNSLILDAQCLVNLEIFNNSTDGSTEGTLFKIMDRCQTSFGKRLLRQWVCRPLSNLNRIRDRQEAVNYLKNNPITLQNIIQLLTKLPDLERKISRIHAKSSNITDINSVISHFESIHQQLLYISGDNNLKRSEIPSKQLANCLLVGEEGTYPDLRNALDVVKNSFTYEDDQLLPTPGVFEEFDQCKAKIDEYEKKLDDHLEEIRSTFKSKEIDFRHMGKDIYQIEIKHSILNRAKVPDNFSLTSEPNKTCKRFHTPFIKSILPNLLEERDTYQVLSKEFLQKIQEQFNQFYKSFQDAVRSLANLDCLLSLYKVSFLSTISMCKPEFSENLKDSFINVKDMVHPCISTRIGDDFIPNDLILGNSSDINIGKEENPSVMVITGPNMGGKSTILRQTCLLVIMAQLGCYVPASECKMSVVDRIFTRLGANDNIMAGQSTFMVELQEAGNVLSYATRNSLVIMDELGRGTSTFDGYSIAYSVLNYITQTLKPLCLFATHYQSLANEPSISKKLSKSYMTCDVDDANKRVLFLYKLAEGVCPNSYGLHVAAMSGLPNEVIKKAEEKASQFEKESVISTYIHGTINRSELVKKIIQSVNSKDLKSLIELQNSLKINDN